MGPWPIVEDEPEIPLMLEFEVEAVVLEWGETEAYSRTPNPNSSQTWPLSRLSVCVAAAPAGGEESRKERRGRRRITCWSGGDCHGKMVNRLQGQRGAPSRSLWSASP